MGLGSKNVSLHTQISIEFLRFCTSNKVINTVPVLVGMYRIGMYTGIDTSTFCIILNTGRTGHTN